jgi:hypothetical protein
MQQTCGSHLGAREYLRGEAMPVGSTTEVGGHVDQRAAHERYLILRDEPPPRPQAFVPIAPDRCAWIGHDAHADRDQARQPYHRAAIDMVDPIVEISPSDFRKHEQMATLSCKHLSQSHGI